MNETHHNVFAGAYIDRASEYRANARWLSKALSEEQARFVLVNKGACLACPENRNLALLRRAELKFEPGIGNAVFLGLSEETPVFAVRAPGDWPAESFDYEFIELRQLGAWLEADQANLAAHAVGMFQWLRTQRFCPRCASKTQIEAAGYASLCANNDCGLRTFPRLDPAIIVLVSDHDSDRCLLGRQDSWPANMFSTIAGFVEPGESLEDAVVREVFEETNIRVDQVHYQSSQPWPFPASLMVGFHARAVSLEIVRNDGELADVGWFSRAELRAERVKIPPPQSISRRLIDSWLNGES